MELVQSAHPLLAIVVGAILSISVVEHMQGQPGRKEGGLTVLFFGPVARFLALASTLLPVLAIAVVWRADSMLTRYLFLLLAAVLAYASVFSVYLSFFVEMAYDELGVYYRSPTRRRVITWSAIQRIGFSDMVQMNYIQVGNGEMFWLSRCMNGFDEFLAQAQSRLSEQGPMGTVIERRG